MGAFQYAHVLLQHPGLPVRLDAEPSVEDEPLQGEDPDRALLRHLLHLPLDAALLLVHAHRGLVQIGKSISWNNTIAILCSIRV